MKVSIFIAAFLFLMFNNSHAIEISIFNKGKTEKVSVTEEQKKQIEQLIKSIYESADKTISYNITKENVKNIKAKEKCVEIIFDGSFNFSNSTIGSNLVHKILIPVSGSFAGDSKSGALNFITGQDDYGDRCYANSAGFKYVWELFKTLQK